MASQGYDKFSSCQPGAKLFKKLFHSLFEIFSPGPLAPTRQIQVSGWFLGFCRAGCQLIVLTLIQVCWRRGTSRAFKAGGPQQHLCFTRLVSQAIARAARESFKNVYSPTFECTTESIFDSGGRKLVLFLRKNSDGIHDS